MKYVIPGEQNYIQHITGDSIGNIYFHTFLQNLRIGIAKLDPSGNPVSTGSFSAGWIADGVGEIFYTDNDKLLVVSRAQYDFGIDHWISLLDTNFNLQWQIRNGSQFSISNEPDHFQFTALSDSSTVKVVSAYHENIGGCIDTSSYPNNSQAFSIQATNYQLSGSSFTPSIEKRFYSTISTVDHLQ